MNKFRLNLLTKKFFDNGSEQCETIGDFSDFKTLIIKWTKDENLTNCIIEELRKSPSVSNIDISNYSDLIYSIYGVCYPNIWVAIYITFCKVINDILLGFKFQEYKNKIESLFL